jgi:hypothetical protein
MNLRIRALMGQIGDLARANGFDKGRVLSKTNRHGELVIALLIPPRSPGEWTPDEREAKRKARGERS